MAWEYDPTYKWFESDADLLAGTVALTSSGDRVGNQILSGEFLFGPFGGCLGGTLETTEEFLTFVRKGWWVLAYLNPANDPVAVARVYSLERTDEGGTVLLDGPIHYLDGFLRQVPFADRIPLEVALHDLAVEMSIVNGAIPGAFVPNAIRSGHFAGWDPQGQDVLSLTLDTQRPFQENAAMLAVVVDNLSYGFFPGLRKAWITPNEYAEGTYLETPTCTPLDFQIVRGKPPRTRTYIDKRMAHVRIQRGDPKERFNRVVLSGSFPEKIWIAQDLDALATEPVKTVWARRAEIGSDALGQRIADSILALGRQEEQFYDVDIDHEESEGSDFNLVERGPIYPWNERPIVKDKFGMQVLAQGVVRGAVLRMGFQPSQSIQMGRSNVDIKSFFGLDTFEESPSRDFFASPGVMPWEAETSHRGPSDIADPPVGIYVRPLNTRGSDETEVIYSAVPACVYRFKNFEIIGSDYTGTVDGVSRHTLRTKSDRFQTTGVDPVYPWRLGTLDQIEILKSFRWADPMTIPFWKDGATGAWRGLATVMEGSEAVSFDTLLTRSGSFLWTNYRVDEAGVDSLVTKLRHGQITSSDIQRLQKLAAGGDTAYIVDPNPGPTEVGGDLWTPVIHGTGINYEELHFVPYSLILHLGGTQRGLIPGADSSRRDANWDYLLSTYGGDGNIYSVESTFYPYEVEVAIDDSPVSPPLADGDRYFPQTTLQSDDCTSHWKNVFYLTKAGAEAAEVLGYFWHEILCWDYDETTFDFDAATPLDAHDMGKYGVFTKRETVDSVDYDTYLRVPLDMPRMLTLYDIHQHPVLGALSQDLPVWYSGLDGHGTKVTLAESYPNEANVDSETAAFVNPEYDDLKLVRKKIFFSAIRPAPPDIYKGDSETATYPGPIRIRRWKVRGFDTSHATAYNAVNNQ